MSDDQIRNLNWYAESDLFSPDEKLVLELADAITATPSKVTPELRERLQQRFSTPQLVELGAAIAWENYRARSNRVFGFGSEGFYDPDRARRKAHDELALAEYKEGIYDRITPDDSAKRE